MGNIKVLNSYYQSEIFSMRKNNKVVEETRAELFKVVEDLESCKRLVMHLKGLKETLATKNSDYIEGIIQMIEDAVRYSINSVLPYREYDVVLDYKPYRNDGHLKLFFIDSEGNRLPPKIIEGDMLNQVLSFSSITHISVMMGYDTIYYDEAFASANIRSLVLINSVIKYYRGMGVNFVFVTQNPALYAGLDRTMIQLVSDGKQIVSVEKNKVLGSDDEFELVEKIREMFDELTMIKE